MNVDYTNYHLRGLGRINILLGKNGCGKSTLLREFEQKGKSTNSFGKIYYISPERGGVLKYEAGIEQAIITNTDWLANARRKNQSDNFKAQTIALFRKLRFIVADAYEDSNGASEKFDVYLNKINSLLDQVEVRRVRPTSEVKFFKRDTGSEIAPEKISSGESELISLGIESLVFSKEVEPDKINVLLLDEPDVHLHPDLQVRLMVYIKELVESNPTSLMVLMATHSTAILGALQSYEYVRVGFMNFGQQDLQFEAINEVYQQILPVFGAHPLSNLFNSAPVLLLEGEDDERIWQQAIRSSNGRILLYPCVCGSVDQISEYEDKTISIVNAVYENAKAYSLRDGDGISQEIDDRLPIIRFRLKCRAAENLLLSNEVLAVLSITWAELEERIVKWIEEKETTGHSHLESMKDFKDNGFDRVNADIKDIRIDLMGIIGSNKPWEVVVGRVISTLSSGRANYSEPLSIYSFLGEKLVTKLL